jgi:hypothetical protein
MKRFLAASCLSLATMVGSASAANVLSLDLGLTDVVLDANYNPSPGTGGLGAGSVVQVASGGGLGLRLNDIADITFTYIGKEAGNTNILFSGVEIFSTLTASGGAAFPVIPGVSAGFLPFNFTSNGTLVATNGGPFSLNSSIAFKVITDTLDYVKVLVLLNDPGSDTDYDDMVIQIEAQAEKRDIPQTPIPGGVVLLMSGLAGLGYMGRSRRAKKA